MGDGHNMNISSIIYMSVKICILWSFCLIIKGSDKEDYGKSANMTVQ